MTNEQRPRGGLRRLLGSSLLAGIGALAAPQAELPEGTRIDEVHPDEDLDLDRFAAGATSDAQVLASVLQQMSTFDATHAAATAALSSDPRVRHVLAEALACPFLLVGDDFVIDQLARDPEREVRVAALRAARVRRLG